MRDRTLSRIAWPLGAVAAGSIPALGGRLEIRTATGTGTTVAGSLPARPLESRR